MSGVDESSSEVGNSHPVPLISKSPSLSGVDESSSEVGNDVTIIDVSRFGDGQE